MAGPRFWAALVLVGVLGGLLGGLLMRLLYAVQEFAWRETGEGLYAAAVQASLETKLLSLLAGGAIVAVGRVALSLPKGGHAADLVEALWFGDGAMPARRTIAQSVLSIVVVGLGAAVGREGALKKASAVCGWQIANRFGFGAEDRRILAACGAGAGMAAAYNIPLGGALFVMEVLLGTASARVAVAAFTSSSLAVVTSWLLLPMHLIYTTPEYPLTANLMVFAAATGPLFGLASIAFVRIIGWADRGKPRSTFVKAVAPLVVFLLLALASDVWPEMIGNGKDVVQLVFEGGGGDPRLHDIATVLGLVVARTLATAFCLRSGTPGGLLTPTLTAGALLGQGAALCWARVLPAAAPGSAAVIGGAAVLAATSGGPISAVVCVLELGRHVDGLIVPILIASAGACLVVRAAGTASVYTVRFEPTGRHPGPLPLENLR